jgi:RNA polymerase sigma-70 factor (ECF subfamily)
LLFSFCQITKSIYYLKNLTDEQIINLIKKNDQQAFRILIDRYENKVAATVIHMLGNTPEADDVGQEVFIRFYQNIHQFRGNSALGTYLTRIAINLSLNEIKRQKIKNMRYYFWGNKQDDEAEKATEFVDTNHYQDRSDTKNLIQKALQKIDSQLRIVVILRMIEGYDTRETAEILEIPQGTVLSRLSRGQQKLREVLLKLGYQP